MLIQVPAETKFHNLNSFSLPTNIHEETQDLEIVCTKTKHKNVSKLYILKL